ncbi:MAG: DUF2478 domain-containing protein [Rhodobacteraceae bacterium]|nr:DUF2478 domain-containing protein [Paracoccaceae bacterium]
MLGYVIASGHGAADRLLAGVAERLAAEGLALAGAVQVNREAGAGRRPHMELLLLAGRRRLRISQDLGPHARGCRLDPAAMAEAAGQMEAALGAEPPPALLVVNKFGKAEAEGRGFRPAIGAALAAGIPVLTAVNRANLAAFEAFAEGLAEPLPAEAGAVIGWCRARIAEARAPA